MFNSKGLLFIFTMLLLVSTSAITAQTLKADGTYDPECVVEQWSNSSTYKKVIDINFNDETWPNTWQGKYAVDCPEYVDDVTQKYGGYAKAILETPANGSNSVTYPVMFYNCTFANKKSYNGLAGTTAAMGRIYDEQSPAGVNKGFPNDWSMTGHKVMLEDNVRYENGKPVYGEAGFVQLCRTKKTVGTLAKKKEWLGWVEIDHIPFVERIQWSWSNTSSGRGIKCDYKIGDGDWQPLVWFASEQIDSKYTAFSDQGYFVENVINAEDVSIRWRVWDGERKFTAVQSNSFPKESVELDWYQAARLHKIQIFGNEITAEQAQYARDNKLNDPGELTDLSIFNGSTSGGGDDYEDNAPDANAPVVFYTVSKKGGEDYVSIQDAIDDVPEKARGIIYIRPGIYDENIYSGTKNSRNKYISLIGEDKETTILTSSVSRGSGSATFNDCAALNVFTDRFYAENITIRNTSGNVGQAEALYTHGDAHIFNNCLLSGYQDTYKANIGARGYFTNCTIVGATDFIYDSGLEWFENCEIRCIKGGNGYVTAAGDAWKKMAKLAYPSLSYTRFYVGLFFNNCNITAEEGTAASSYTLGRPWKEQAGTMFMNCTLGNHIKPAGWTDWNNVGSGDKCTYFEYKNKNTDGSLVDVSKRVSWSHQATDEEVEAYMNADFMFKLASDVPFDYKRILQGTSAPASFNFDGNTISWEKEAMAAGYILYKDGVFETILKEPTITLTEGDNAVYSVKAISRHGVTSNEKKIVPPAKLIAFPTAEGFGKYTSGGRGGEVVKVTSLEDDEDGIKTGTLRWAFKQHSGKPITIVFAVSGEIKLKSEMRIKRNDWTLAGQTAPGEGIVITHNKMNFGGSQNFIVRNVRFRIGQKSTAGEILMESAIGAENCANYIFDHCSVGWSVEENMDTQDSHFLTVQNTIVHEGLYDAGHGKGARGYGAQWGGSPATYHHNLLAHNKSRSPRFNGARGEDKVVFIEYANNINYNYGGNGGCYGGENTADVTPRTDPDGSGEIINSRHECNFMNNYYKHGPASNSSGVCFVNSSYARSGATSHGPAKWFVNGNISTASSTATADNWKGMQAETYSLSKIRVDERIVPKYPYYRYTLAGGEGRYIPSEYMLDNIESADEAFNNLIVNQNVGCINKDRIETRIIGEVLNGTTTYQGKTGNGATSTGGKGIINFETDCEGFYAYSTNYTVPTDSDGDGMPDEWESQHGLNPYAADQNSVNSDGYTALEVYLNSLMGENMDEVFTSGIKFVTMKSASMSYDNTTGTLHFSDNAIGGVLSVYSTNGQLLYSANINSTSMFIGNIPTNVMLVRLDGKTLCPRVIKIVK